MITCYISTDVSQAASIQALMTEMITTYGRLDCAFNNAGIEGVIAPVADLTEEVWNGVPGLVRHRSDDYFKKLHKNLIPAIMD